MRQPRLFFPAFGALVFSVSTLCAGTLYVSGEGNDANAGTSPAKAFRSLQKAADLAEPGDTVLVGDGTYLDSADTKDSESALLRLVKVARPDAWITFRAAPGAKPVLRPRGWTGILITGSYYVIDGLTVTGF
ncbi:MAG: hypothetical protein H7067_15840, partial [Burkholderiales bacterium]|nr:hypothetical protein [Opitutaceae bacterium]